MTFEETQKEYGWDSEILDAFDVDFIKCICDSCDRWEDCNAYDVFFEFHPTCTITKCNFYKETK